MFRFIFLCVLLLNSCTLFAEQLLAQFVDPIDGKIDASNYLSENVYGFLPVPIIITDPALDSGLGMVGLFFHESEEDANKRIAALKTSEGATPHLFPPSVSALGGAYTGNDSWFGGAAHLGFFKQGDIRYLGATGYGDVNLNFYGFGDFSFNRPLEINTQAIAVLQNLKFRVADTKLFVGIKQNYTSASLKPTKLPDFSNILPPNWQGPVEEVLKKMLSTDITTSGLGLVFEFDNRDNFFSPNKGYRYSLDITRFDEHLGSDIEYDLYFAEGLNYWQLNDSWRFALKLSAEHANTNTLLPPYALPSIKLRGVPMGRYQGDYVFSTESEINYDINNRWSISAFTGLGRFGTSLDSIKSGNSQIAKGVGFRYLIARRYGFKMGLDVAFGPEETVWYVQAGTAW
ncbi:BamA/TamA family outer membrane protein [Pseudoalteromonas sp. G4]|uniref:BamA/TamA family outer membrane protein n=1 Tax=Pseudoalteromonas sp. G4 TaxID=2992761 RepID=UPI00237E2EE6|nr:BamA/TamA family outer membrane protein [Pseudoalteromonas sp. G4]MDE3271444.1 BamA/TamA family outer membrane protein [Pseudoalteromonas sp. G4]